MSVERRFGRNLVRLRKGAGLSQEQLAFLASLHRTEIGMLERGTRLARIDTLLKLAGALEVEPCALTAGISWHPGDMRPGKFLEGGQLLRCWQSRRFALSSTVISPDLQGK